MKTDTNLILVAPARLANDRARSMLFSDAAPVKAKQQGLDRIFSISGFGNEGQELVISDLSDQPPHLFSTSVISSNADVMLLIVDVTSGLDKRDYSSKTLACLAAIPEIVLVVDNMAASGWSAERFKALKSAFEELATETNCQNLSVIPVDLQLDSNIHTLDDNLSWYNGPSLMELLPQLTGKKHTADKETTVHQSDQFAANICWTSKEPMLPGRQYLLETDEENVGVSISALKYRLSLETGKHQAATGLNVAEIGYGNLSLDRPVPFALFGEDRKRGKFRLIDRQSGEQVALCLIRHSLRRATNIQWQEMEIGKTLRSKAMQQIPRVLWFTGYSGSGKSAIASLVEQKLHASGRFTYILDGDNIRHGLCRDLGFTDVDRVENLRRISETAKLFVDAGMIVLVSFISPFRSERQMAREKFDAGEFIEIFVDTPFETCEKRDPKGLYKLARSGELKNFTGLDSPYEPPISPEIHLSGGEAALEELANEVIAYLDNIA